MGLCACAWRLTLEVSSMGAWGATAGNVKLLLPPRQSRGISFASLELLRQILVEIISPIAQDFIISDGVVVRAIDIEAVRQKFYEKYLANGDTETKATDCTSASF